MRAAGSGEVNRAAESNLTYPDSRLSGHRGEGGGDDLQPTDRVADLHSGVDDRPPGALRATPLDLAFETDPTRVRPRAAPGEGDRDEPDAQCPASPEAPPPQRAYLHDPPAVSANEEEPVSRAALLIVDVQNEAVARGPYLGAAVLANIADLLGACRSTGMEVVYVQHEEAAGSDGAAETEEWEIHDSVRPEPGEKIVRKRFNSAFKDTDLLRHLRSRGIATLILVGIQTEYCVDTTCRVAFEHGFRIIMPEGTNTTYDNGEVSARQIYELYNERIFAGRFADVTPLNEALDMIMRGELE